MAIGINLSPSYWATRKRIQRIPKMFLKTASAIVKKDALNLMNNFHNGIKQNSFRLAILADETIEKKVGLGLERPETPLYAFGDEKKEKAYLNSLRIRKLKNGWRVFVSRGMHHSGRISLIRLYGIHEFGAIIKKGDRLIRIPPRPALHKAFLRTLRQRKLKEDSKIVRKAYTQFLNKGQEKVVEILNGEFQNIDLRQVGNTEE